MSTIKFDYISDYNEAGPVRSAGSITIEQYGKRGWTWGNARTNEAGNGLWANEQQVKGTGQFSLSSNPRKALYKLAKIEANFNSVGHKFEDLHCEYEL